MMYASIAMSVASTAAAFYGQQQQAKAQDAFNRQRQQLGTQRALANYANQTRQARERQIQQREAAANEINEVNREARKRIATAHVAGSDAGIAGGSLETLMNDFHRQQLEFGTNVRRNMQFSDSNIEDQLESVRLGAQGNIENLQFMPAARPSFLGAGLRIGSAVLGAYNQYMANTGQWGPPSDTGVTNRAFGSSGIPYRIGTYGAGGMGPDYLGIGLNG
jgi:hypothetical protein